MKTKLCLTLILVSLLSACSPAPGNAPLLSSIPALTPTPQATATPAPTAESDDTAYSPYGPIVVNGFLLGGYDGQWINDEQIFDLIQDMESYRVYVAGAFVGIEQGEKIAETEEEGYCGNRVQLSMHSDTDELGENSLLAISSKADPFIRPVEKLDAADSQYQSIVDGIAAAEGFASLKLAIRDVLLADIDGDGESELLINANNEATYEEDNVFGSVLLVQKSTGQNFFIDKTFLALKEGEEGTFGLDRYKILDICDLNGDGSMELIVKSYGIDLLEYGVFTFSGGAFTLVMSNGAGA